VLLLIEVTDVLFAVDSVPAVLAVSHEQFIVFASNAFAILGLRALYFLLADMHARFSYLQQGLAIILAFVGIKMIIHDWYHIPTWLSLLVIALVLAHRWASR
jgi:tellurite resistance protein TerC